MLIKEVIEIVGENNQDRHQNYSTSVKVTIIFCRSVRQALKNQTYKYWLQNSENKENEILQIYIERNAYFFSFVFPIPQNTFLEEKQ